MPLNYACENRPMIIAFMPINTDFEQHPPTHPVSPAHHGGYFF